MEEGNGGRRREMVEGLKFIYTVEFLGFRVTP
jgi:hypothetical protein